MVALEVVKMVFGNKKSEGVEANWENTFSKKEIPEDVLQINVTSKDLLVDVLLGSKIVSSKTEFRRLVDSGAITNLETKEKIKDYNVIPTNGTYRIGKKRFIKIENV